MFKNQFTERLQNGTLCRGNMNDDKPLSGNMNEGKIEDTWLNRMQYGTLCRGNMNDGRVFNG